MLISSLLLALSLVTQAPAKGVDHPRDPVASELLRQASTAARQISDPSTRSTFLGHIADWQVKNGERTIALHTYRDSLAAAHSSKSADDVVFAETNLVYALGQFGETALATEIAVNGHTPAREKELLATLKEATESQVAPSTHPFPLDYAAYIDPAIVKHLKVARTAYLAGDRKRIDASLLAAMQAARRIQKGDARSLAVYEIAKVLGGLDRIDDAIRLCETLPVENGARSWQLWRLVDGPGMSRANSLRAAAASVRWADKWKHGYWRLDLLNNISERQRWLGDPLAARRTALQSYRGYLRDGKGHVPDASICALVDALAAGHEFKIAEQIANSDLHGKMRGRAIMTLAGYRAECGDWKVARDLWRKGSQLNPSYAKYQLRTFADRLTTGGLIKEGQAFASKFPPEDKWLVLFRMGMSRITMRDYPWLTDWARRGRLASR
jgi:hypothetical protein